MATPSGSSFSPISPHELLEAFERKLNDRVAILENNTRNSTPYEDWNGLIRILDVDGFDLVRNKIPSREFRRAIGETSIVRVTYKLIKLIEFVLMWGEQPEKVYLCLMLEGEAHKVLWDEFKKPGEKEQADLAFQSALGLASHTDDEDYERCGLPDIDLEKLFYEAHKFF